MRVKGGPKSNLWYSIMMYGLEYLGIYYSSYRAFVVDNEDPLGMNRLQLLIPHLNELQTDGYWAFPKTNLGGKNYGMQVLPQKGDMVWVEFEYGKGDYPIWSPASYGEEEKPEEFSTPRHYGFKTPNGNLVLINDNKGEEEILVKHKTDEEWVKITESELELESKLIKLGKQGEEWAIMGETLLEKLENIMDKLDETYTQFKQHIHTTNVGPSGPPITAPAIGIIQNEMSSIKESLVEILSDKVKIDK